jgi:plastocyanin
LAYKSLNFLNSLQNAMRTRTKTIKKYVGFVGVAAVAAVALLVVVAPTLSISSAQSSQQGLLVEGQGQQQQTDSGPSAVAAAQNKTTTKVAAGGEGPISVVTWFVPQNVSIRAGDTVTWTNPTTVAEPHTVSFMKQKDYFAKFVSPYLIANGTQLRPANPEEKNTEPLIIPAQNGTTTSDKVVVGANARSTNPVVIDAQGNVKYLPLNANYTMTGDELYVNSGWIWPEGQSPPDAAPIKSFSITFEKAGTYDYLCEIHPWMTGKVMVQ